MLGGEGSNTGSNSGFWTNATQPDNIVAFASNIKSLLQANGFDGVDLDWEEDLDYQGMLRLVTELRRIWPDAIITIPTGFTGADAANLAACSSYVDAFMPMTYIPIAQWGGWSVPVPPTPLYAYGSNPYSFEVVLNKWIDAGVPASKIVMGIGGFGQVWGDKNGDGRAPNAPYYPSTENPEGEKSAMYSDNVITQKWLDQTITVYPELVEKWDDVGKCSFWAAPAPNDLVTVPIKNTTVDVGLIFYETKKSMEYKYNFIADNNMKGMMFWTLLMLKDGDNTYPILKNVKEFKVK